MTEFKKGDYVRYASGSTAFVRLVSPHAGGWHGEHCLGGIQFVSQLAKLTTEETARCRELFRKVDKGKRRYQADEEIRIINNMCSDIFNANVAMGWYSNPKTGERIERNVPEMLMLTVSEVAEGMEGYRKNKMDDHLPERPMLEVELADAAIRIFDLAGYLGLDLGGAIAAKRAYNFNRADHKLENRAADPEGKRF